MDNVDDKVKSRQQLSDYAIQELHDDEVIKVAQIVNAARNKYRGRPNTPQNLEMLRDEMLTRFAEIGVLAEFDPTPCFYGEPPVVEIKGRVAGHDSFKHGFDHEKKGWEVNTAKQRGEHFRGEKEGYDTRRPK